MKKYIIQRIISLIIVLIGISIIAFLLGVFSPGDPAELALSNGGNYAPTETQIQEMRIKMGLDKPYVEQYYSWMKKTLSGDLGISYYSNRNVSDLFAQKIPITLKLSAYAFLSTVIFGLGLGILAASFRDSAVDNIIMTIVNILLSLPGFWVALLAVLIFSEKLKWLPTSGYGGIKHFIMPAGVLSIATIATTARLMRSSMLKELGRQYVLAGTARGISKKNLVLGEALPNAIISVLPMLGNYVGAILGGSAVIELIFALPGIGSLAVSSVLSKDFPVIQAYVIFTGVVFVLVSTAVDLISVFVDPRLRVGEKK